MKPRALAVVVFVALMPLLRAAPSSTSLPAADPLDGTPPSPAWRRAPDGGRVFHDEQGTGGNGLLARAGSTERLGWAFWMRVAGPVGTAVEESKP
jgi:hypothetical protein